MLAVALSVNNTEERHPEIFVLKVEENVKVVQGA